MDWGVCVCVYVPGASVAKRKETEDEKITPEWSEGNKNDI